MSRILPLPLEAVSQIRSSKHITSLQGVTLSLLENSLDAGATKVDISLDFRRGGCTVEDDGLGIREEEFLEEGGLGKMHHTSRSYSGLVEHELHGTSGTFLASLAALSLLSITSRQSHVDHSVTLVMHRGRAVERQLPSSPGQELSPTSSHGTRVTVRDLFGNMPVRVKQRASTIGSPSGEDKAWQEVTLGVTALMLAWHGPCTVRIHDSEPGKKTMQLSAQHPSISNALTSKSLNTRLRSSVKYELRDALPILSQVGLAPIDVKSSWVPISASTSKLSVKGAINLQPAPTKRCQFISIGIHPYHSDSSLSDLYDVVNKVFINSCFGNIERADEAEIDNAEKDRRKRDRRYKSDGYTQNQLRGQKGVDRWPMFVLQARLTGQRTRRVDAENVNDGNLKAIADILELVATQWLEAQHLRPKKRRLRKSEEQNGPAIASSPSTLCLGGNERLTTIGSASTSKKRRYLDIDGRSQQLEPPRPTSMPSRNADFSTWSRIKSGREEFYDEVWEGKRPSSLPTRGTESVKPSTPGNISRPFNVPSLEAGSLSRKSGASHTGDTQPQADGTPSPTARHPSHIESDDFGSVDDEALIHATEAAEQSINDHGDGVSLLDTTSTDRIVEWIDPITKRVFEVNARTGIVLPTRSTNRQRPTIDQNPTDSGSNRDHAAINTSLSSAGLPLSLSRRPKSTAKDDQTQWLPGFLKDWNNPIFTSQNEEKIAVASLDGLGLDASELASRRCTDHHHAIAFSEIGLKSTAKLSKEMLRNVKVLRQVDRKFILCKMDHLLVLVDQHAASERVILENLFTELCTTSQYGTTGLATTHLVKPIRFEVSPTEYDLFRAHQPRLANWGVVYNVSYSHQTQTASHVRHAESNSVVTIASLPPPIAERCTKSVNLIIDLLRTEIWHLTADKAAINTTSSDEDHPWLRKLSTCPKGIIEMLNSRACRSAIMFNDELSVLECEELLEGLGKCAFPFMCAHGRVSMVPLVELGGDRMLFVQEEEKGGTFGGWLASRRSR